MKDVKTLFITWHSVGPVLLNTFYHMAFRWSCALWGTIVQQDDAINGVTWLSVTDFGMQILKCVIVMVCSHYITFLSVVARISPWPSGPVWLDSLYSTPFLSWATLSPIPATQQIDQTVLHKCLPVYLPSQMYSCATHTSTAEL